MKIKYKIPPTDKMGDCTLVGTASLTETARANALWQYNNMLAHDGLGPVKNFPPGTQSERADAEER